MAGAVVFIILFAGTTLFHIYQMVRTRTWFFLPFVIGGIFEVLGYIGRAMSSRESPNWTLGPYLIQTLFLLLAPALLAASIYMFLGRIILVLRAESHAIMRKKWLTKVFVTGDVLSFLLQGSGGGIQSGGTLDSMKLGEKIIVIGLFVQIFFFGFFIITAGSFDMKLKKYPIPRCHLPEIPWRKHMNVLYASSMLIMIRSVFRLVEYLQGNNGYLLHHEIFLYIFDAVLILIAMVIFNICHPSGIGQLLANEADYELKDTYSAVPMADPGSVIGTVAAVLQLAQTACKAALELYNFCSVVQNAPQEIITISRDAHAFYMTISNLESSLRSDTVTTVVSRDAELMTALETLKIPIENCSLACEAILEKLQPHLRVDGSSSQDTTITDTTDVTLPIQRRFSRRNMMWYFKRKEIIALAAELERSKATLGGAMRNAIFLVALKIHAVVGPGIIVQGSLDTNDLDPSLTGRSASQSIGESRGHYRFKDLGSALTEYAALVSDHPIGPFRNYELEGSATIDL
ncbi:hypothetical protein ANOM_005700 [Aspergillus nomiae NRRL 13137]|uniref:RTA1 domain protein n=1 Tax=Aspergillus nomiae NRRL (strain ATCC 15546 / NRRL 13137 / CBS 260.88 / M93) TaxID=1509407 RepID=A0A0L1J6P0_ASPN3|nr:uncharacterized protein ANOM_005700 [Aspergillus nomiae NRRL 13137]KNG87073.1 hypothetical protein ANOM_005700 [Aspergillus nomiae NRRL 13137]